MDDHRFDDISRAFATRRGILGAIGGAIAALGFGSAGAQSGGNGNGNGNGNQGSGNGNGNGNGNTGWGNGNWNGNGNSGNGNGNGNGNWNPGNRNGNGNGNSNGWCPPWLSCPGSGYVDDATCTCVCDLTVSDCPGGVDSESCTCIPITCGAKQDDCGDPSFTCSCGELLGSSELVCIDRTGPNGYTCESASVDSCPAGMVCAGDDGCGGGYCYPRCGEAAAFAMIPDRLV